MSALDHILSDVVDVRVARLPVPVPAYRRIAWLLGASHLALDKSRGKSATLEQLHLVVWAMKSPTTRGMFAAWWHGDIVPGVASARFEPLLPIVLSVAASEDLISFTPTGRCALTDRGRSLIDAINASERAFATEKLFLSEIRGTISAAAVTRHLDRMSWW